MKTIALACALLLLTSVAFAQATLINPLLPSGPDPWVIRKDGWYYYMNTTGRNLVIRKTAAMENLAAAATSNIEIPKEAAPFNKEIWAPELHFLDGKWYIYYSADDGNNDHHRIYVLENASADPMMSVWTYKGRIGSADDHWAIDGDVFTWKGRHYLIWSGWEGEKNIHQDIYIARMKNPWTIDGPRVRISQPQYPWEKHGDGQKGFHIDVNEGPQSLMHNNRLFIVYSASACWTDHYALGLLSLKGDNPLDSSAWTKHAQPVFMQSKETGVYATGHNSFFRSPDGKEDWILYHANSKPGDGCGNKRSPRAQPFTWSRDGLPDFGVPVRAGVPIPAPSR